jgi:hypothetical protein
LQDHLRTRFSGQTLTFGALIDEGYPDGTWLEGHYREAIKALERSPAGLAVNRVGLTPTGRPRTSLIDSDTITFPAVMGGTAILLGRPLLGG